MFAPVNGGFQFVVAQVCLYAHGPIIAVQRVPQQCKTLPTRYSSLLRAEVDGVATPPARLSNYLVSRLGPADGSNLGMWKYRVNLINPGRTFLEGPFLASAALYDRACFRVAWRDLTLRNCSMHSVIDGCS